MQRMTLQASRALALIISGMLASAPALADKPSWAGGQKGGKQSSSGADQRGAGEHKHFGDKQRAAAHEYYAEQLHAGHCPPGLAKKRNGCMPPGQAKKWKMGQPLPPDLTYYSLPPQLAERIGPPPAGHSYVRVATDILLIAIGTAIVVDAIEDLGKM